MLPVCSDPTPMYRERSSIPRAPLSALLFVSVLHSALANEWHSFLYAAGQFTPLEVPFAGVTATHPYGINER